jgi:F420H(2)-dependent quinone reductase
MAEYIPSPRERARDQAQLYERSGGTERATLRDTGLPVIMTAPITFSSARLEERRQAPSGCTTCAPVGGAG